VKVTEKQMLARVSFRNGEVSYYKDSAMAYAVYLALPKGVRACFRAAGDLRPIYSWDYVDKLEGKSNDSNS